MNDPSTVGVGLILPLRVTFIAMFAMGLFGGVASAQQFEVMAMPGNIYTVNGHQMHLYCTGEGDQTVILEAGVGGYTLNWWRVQPRIAEFARVCSYDRVGYGWSSPRTSAFDANEAVANLRGLLVAGGVQPPYVMVAHSFGGVIVRAYQQQYPADVTGMVLVETVTPDMAARIPFYEDGLRLQLDALRVVAPLARWRAAQQDEFDFPVPEDVPEIVVRTYAAQVLDRTFFDAAATEAEYIVGGLTQLDLPQSIGDVPLVVIAHGIPREDQFLGAPMTRAQAAEAERVWQQLQRELVTLSPRGDLIIAEDSTHNVQFDAPGVIVDAVQAVMQPH